MISPTNHKTIPSSARGAHANIIIFRAQMHLDALAVVFYFSSLFIGLRLHVEQCCEGLVTVASLAHLNLPLTERIAKLERTMNAK